MVASDGSGDPEQPAVRLRNVSRRFGQIRALEDLSLEVGAGEIHAVLGPNGAGKTTLMRLLSGLVEPHEGELSFHGVPTTQLPRAHWRRLLGLVPSGDRSFYLRVSGLENLVFFARLHGLRRAEATERSWELLRAVGLADAARMWVGKYSHGMQKRLSVARALLVEPSILLIDEATHDLDPHGAQRVRDLVAEAAGRGAAVLWASQRIDEIRDFADAVTLLHRGTVRFRGTVPELLATAAQPRYLVRLDDGVAETLLGDARAALAGIAEIDDAPRSDGHFVLELGAGATLGEAVTSLVGAGILVLACHEERSGIEQAFLHLTEEHER